VLYCATLLSKHHTSTVYRKENPYSLLEHGQKHLNWVLANLAKWGIPSPKAHKIRLKCNNPLRTEAGYLNRKSCKMAKKRQYLLQKNKGMREQIDRFNKAVGISENKPEPEKTKSYEITSGA